MKAVEVAIMVRGAEEAVVGSKSQDLAEASVAAITVGVGEEVVTCAAAVIATSTITVVGVIWAEATDINSTTIKAKIIR